MYEITKEVYFCYGHRLMNHPGKCRHLHGHSVKAAISLASPSLDRQGMVCDFSTIAQAAAEYIDRELDHNLLLHKHDPLLELLRDAGERYLPMDDHPTAEFLAQLIFHHIKQLGYPVTRVTLWETSSACATYYEL